jgi:Zn-dependent oligopeptidase
VTTGLLQVYQDILGLKFEEVEQPHVWHPDVRLFAVFDTTGKDSGDVPLGHFFLDLYPRDGKYGHAAVWGLVPRHVQWSGDDVGYVTKPLCAMVCNFPKPSDATPRPTVGHSDVVTLFHEFGHVMHGVLTQSNVSRFSGTRVERDFVEAPSQMLENWGYERDVLNRLSDRPLPVELCASLKQSRLANIAYLTSRQLFFATFDLELHTRPEGPVGTGEVAGLWKRLSDEVVGVRVPEDIENPAASFGHIMGGYDAGYYGYMWSEVYSMDMYSVFEAAGSVMNQELGLRYRDCILAPGLTHDSREGLERFLGREPSMDAFFRHLGIEGDASKL